MRSTEREDDEHYRSASSAHAGRCYLARQGREIKRLDRRESNRCTIPYYQDSAIAIAVHVTAWCGEGRQRF